jgi:hypothetical protein
MKLEAVTSASSKMITQIMEYKDHVAGDYSY